MKKCFFISSAILVLFTSSCQKNKEVTVSGEIANYMNTPLLIADDYNLVPDTIAVKNGEFSTSITLNKPRFKYLILGENRKKIFLNSNYSLKLLVDEKNFEHSLKFTGVGANENIILDSISVAVNKVDKKFIYNATADIAVKYVDSLFNEYQKHFDKLISSTQVDPLFIEFERISLTYNAASVKLQIGLQNDIKDPAYYSFLKRLDFENDNYIDIPEYKGFLNTYLSVQTNNILGGKDSADNSPNEKYLDALLLSIQKFKNKKIREYFIFEKISLYMENDLIDDLAKYQKYFTTYNSDSIYAKKMQINYSINVKKNILTPGKYAPEFTLVDMDSNEVSLKNFKGKYVYIDFWATWCHPCLEEFPDYIKLQSDYKNKDIAFIRISLDDDKNKWRRFSKEDKDKKGNLYAEKGMSSEVSKAYQIKFVPVFVLIDKDGKIILHRAEPPSSNGIRSTLDSLLRISG